MKSPQKDAFERRALDMANVPMMVSCRLKAKEKAMITALAIIEVLSSSRANN
jgi:hypothetical protein